MKGGKTLLGYCYISLNLRPTPTPVELCHVLHGRWDDTWSNFHVVTLSSSLHERTVYMQNAVVLVEHIVVQLYRIRLGGKKFEHIVEKLSEKGFDEAKKNKQPGSRKQ